MAKSTKIIRFMKNDIKGDLNMLKALKKIKGVGFAFADSICKIQGIKLSSKFEESTEEQRKKLEEMITSPSFPKWMLNRRNDPETGENKHLSGTDIMLTKRSDINNLKKIRAYKGIRHEQGQPVRGQSTRSTFRTQKTVGVSKKGNKGGR